MGGPRGWRAPWAGWDQGKHQHNSLRSADASLGTYMMLSLIPTRPGGRKRCGFSRKNQVPLAPRRDRRSRPERRAPPGQSEIRTFFEGPSARPKALGRGVLVGFPAPMGFASQKQSRGLSASKASKSPENQPFSRFEGSSRAQNDPQILSKRQKSFDLI